MSWSQRYWGLIVGLCLVVVFLALFTGMALANWPDLGMGPDTCLELQPDGSYKDTCYCETIRDGKVKQPANTWSDLGFMVAGLIILTIVGNENGRRQSGNPMTTGHWLAAIYGIVIIFMGPGSMMFHASFTSWGGFLDSISMFFLLTFLIGYDLRQMTDLPEWAGWLIALGILALFLTLRLIFPEQATLIFLGMALVAVGFEVPIWFGWGVRIKRSVWWLIAFGGTFFTALLIWGLSHTDGVLCDPDAWLWQGHVWWHLGSAAAMFILFYYMRSETGNSR